MLYCSHTIAEIRNIVRSKTKYMAKNYQKEVLSKDKKIKLNIAKCLLVILVNITIYKIIK